MNLGAIFVLFQMGFNHRGLLQQFLIVLIELIIEASDHLLPILQLLCKILYFRFISCFQDFYNFLRRVELSLVSTPDGADCISIEDSVILRRIHTLIRIIYYQTLPEQSTQQMKVIASLKDHINWFPGHMKKTLRLIEQNCHKVDVFIQIRDARIPYCSRNPQFDLIIKKNQKEKVIIFNKYDLCNPNKTDKIINDYNDYGIKCFAVSSQKHDDMRKMLAYFKENYSRKYKQVGLWLMACGTPNVGKSSIINQLRSISDLENKRATAKATASVCTTRGIGGFKILNNPLMFLMDTPGVMIPSVIPKELGLKMAVLGLIKDQIVDKQTIINYIIEQCDADQNDKYWKNLRIEKPMNATQFLDSIRSKHKLFDYDAAYDRIITNFREGKLGNVTLDDPITV